MSVFQDNRRLLDDFRLGKQAALTRVYLAYVDDVARLVHRGFFMEAQGQIRVAGIFNPEIERELIQEVFVRAFSQKARESYDGLRDYRPYLLQVAKNLVIDHWRKQGREILSDATESEPAIVDESPDEQIQWRTLQQATKAYVNSLTSKEKEFVRLRFEEEYSQYDLMRQMKCTRWQIRAMEKKVQAGLLKHLSQQGLNDFPPKTKMGRKNQ